MGCHIPYWIFGSGKTYFYQKPWVFKQRKSENISKLEVCRVPSHCLGRTRSGNRNWPAVSPSTMRIRRAKLSWYWIKLWVITVIHQLRIVKLSLGPISNLCPIFFGTPKVHGIINFAKMPCGGVPHWSKQTFAPSDYVCIQPAQLTIQPSAEVFGGGLYDDIWI